MGMLKYAGKSFAAAFLKQFPPVTLNSFPIAFISDRALAKWQKQTEAASPEAVLKSRYQPGDLEHGRTRNE